MGRRGHGIPDGDGPLDTLGDVAAILRQTLHPLDFGMDTARRVAGNLEKLQDQILTNLDLAEADALAVVAAASAHTGAAMTPALKDAFQKAIDAEAGHSTDRKDAGERANVPGGLKGVVEAHVAGKRIEIQVVGQFEI
jgi:hypothetical protein